MIPDKTLPNNLEKATIALKEGKKQTALELIKQELVSHPQNIPAILFLAQIVEDSSIKEKCYRWILRLDANNLQAQVGLSALSLVPEDIQASQPSSGIREASHPQPQQVRQGHPLSSPLPVTTSVHSPAPVNSHKNLKQAGSKAIWGWLLLVGGFAAGFINPIMGIIIQFSALVMAIILIRSPRDKTQGTIILVIWLVIQAIAFGIGFMVGLTSYR